MASFIAALAQIAALVRKELLALINEPASRVILIAPAFLQALMYGYGATYDLTHVPYAVLDQSCSAASIELLARLDDACRTGGEDETFRRVAASSRVPVNYMSRADVTAMVRREYEDYGRNLGLQPE